jgi:hypothetical protein
MYFADQELGETCGVFGARSIDPMVEIVLARS